MPTYTLELDLFGVYTTDMPGFEILTDGTIEGTPYSISNTGTSISIIVNYGGTLPSSLEFRFNDALPESGRSIEIRGARINGRSVNSNNFLSTDTLTNGSGSTVDITNGDFLFDNSDPAASEFTTSATETFTAGNDTYLRYNDTDDEVFDMLDGRDVAYLGSGNDKVNGGNGNDIIKGGAGNDLIYGGADNGVDKLYGGDGDDTIYGGGGNDRIQGDDGNDEIHGGDGNDRLSGNDGNDTITGGDGDDKINGGSGTNILYGDAGNDTIQGGINDDSIDGGADDDLLFGGDGNDIIHGGIGNDEIIIGRGTDTAHGEGGNDTFYIGSSDFTANNRIYGGVGTDELVLSQAMTVDFATGVIEGIETLSGSDAAQNVTLSVTQFYGLIAIDYGLGVDSQTISVAGVHDITALTVPTVTGLESSSLIFSSGADELTITGNQLDSLSTGLTTLDTLGGADVLNITSTSVNLNTYGAINGNLVGLETISASGATGDVVVSLSGQTENFNLTGGNFNDTLTGGAGGDTINGGDGNNILTGLDGNDNITGGTGNDTILGGNGDDILVGGAGDDTIYGATIIGESGIETVVQTNSTTWHTVTFSAALLNPVVKMSNLTNNDGDPYSIRVRDLTETGFEWQIDEFDYLDGSRVLAEDVSWLAISEGTHTLDNGAVIQAGRASVTNEALTTVTFNSAFGSAPIVLSQTITDNDPSAVVTRNRSINTTSFRVNLLEEEVTNGVHGTEEVGWIAIEAVGSPASGFLVGSTTPTVDETVTTINFGSAFDNVPVFVHDQQTTNGGDTSFSQADGVTTTTARVLIGEEQSRDAEINHPGTESVGYFALNEGLITAAGGGDNTFTGGAGVDTLFGGDGADTFIFEALNAYISNDFLADFSAGEGDILDISDLITSGTVNAGNISNYLNFDESSGTETVIQVDGAGGSSFSDIGIINGITGLDEATLFSNGNIIA